MSGNEWKPLGPLMTTQSRNPQHSDKSQRADEQRRFTRIEFHTLAQLESAEQHWPVILEDICLQGAKVALPEAIVLPPDELFLLRVLLSDGYTEICMTVDVAHHGNGHMGLRCLRLDLDSATHLRRLIELNKMQNGGVAEELFALVDANRAIPAQQE